MKCLRLGQFLSNNCSYSQWYLVHVYILAWPLSCSHPYLTLICISQSIRHATLSYLLILSFWILIRMFALISSRSGSHSAMLLRWALLGHHGPLVLFFPEVRIWHFMQIVSNGNNLHEMSKPVFWKKIKKTLICHLLKILSRVQNIRISAFNEYPQHMIFFLFFFFHRNKDLTFPVFLVK